MYMHEMQYILCRPEYACVHLSSYCQIHKYIGDDILVLYHCAVIITGSGWIINNVNAHKSVQSIHLAIYYVPGNLTYH